MPPIAHAELRCPAIIMSTNPTSGIVMFAKIDGTSIRRMDLWMLLANSYFGIDLADEVLEHITRTKLIELRCAVGNHQIDRLCPANR